MDDMPDAMDWRVDTPPKVYTTSYNTAPKRNRDESPEEEQELQQERPSRYDPTNNQLPPIGNGFTREDFLNFGQHELILDENYRQHNNYDQLANRPVASNTAPFANHPSAADPALFSNFEPGHPPAHEQIFAEPLAPQPARGQDSGWSQFYNSVTNAVTVLVTCVSATAYVAKSLGDRTFKAGRWVYKKRDNAREAVADTVTAFVAGASTTKRRIVAFARSYQPPPPSPRPVRRRSPPRMVNRPHPHMTSTGIQLENTARARREALKPAAMDTTASGTDRFEPVMSGALPYQEVMEPMMSGALQSVEDFEPTIGAIQTTFGSQFNFRLVMPGAMPEDIIVDVPAVFTGADLIASTTAGQAILVSNASLDTTISNAISTSTAMEAPTERIPRPWDEDYLDIPYTSDSDMEEVMSEDTEYETPITDDTDPEAMAIKQSQWPAIAELQQMYENEDDSAMDLTLEVDEPSELSSELMSSHTPQPAASGLSNVTCSPLYQTPFVEYQEAQSSPLSELPSNLDMSPPDLMTVRRSAKKSVGFYESPKTGRPVDRIKKYYINEPMGHPVSSSPPEYSEEDSISSTVDSDISIYDDPIMQAAATAHWRSLQQQKTIPSLAVDQRSLALATNDDSSYGNPETTGNLHRTDLVPASIGPTDFEIEGSAGYTPTDASFISHGSPDIDPTDNEIVGAVGSPPAAASLIFNGPILAPIHNNQYTGRNTRRRPGNSLVMVTAQGSPIKKRCRPPPPSARILSRLSMESMTMKENVTPPTKMVNTPSTTPIYTTPPRLFSFAENPADTPEGDISAGQQETFQKQATAAEGIATPGPRSDSSTQSTPHDDLSTQLGSLSVSNRRLSVRKRKQELEEQKLREEEEQRVAQEKARKEREEAEAAAERARLEKEKAEEEEARAAKEAEEERKKNNVRDIPTEPVIQPLNDDWEAKVDAAMAKQRNHMLVKTSIGTSLTRKDFGTLFPQPGKDPASGWLNDEIIMAYLQAVVDHGRDMSGYKDGDIPKFHAFNTFFFKNIRDKGVQSVKRWATRAKIGGKNLDSVERVFIPVHSGAHWTLLIVSPIARTIEYFDSMDGATEPYTKAAKDWLKQEMGKTYKDEEWSVVLPEGGGPQQSNGSDCGVFTVTTAKMVVLGIDPSAYSSLDIPLQRKRMVAELMNGGFTADFAPRFTFGGAVGSDDEEEEEEEEEESLDDEEEDL